jgi:hypothetical protein
MFTFLFVIQLYCSLLQDDYFDWSFKRYLFYFERGLIGPTLGHLTYLEGIYIFFFELIVPKASDFLYLIWFRRSTRSKGLRNPISKI